MLRASGVPVGIVDERRPGDAAVPDVFIIDIRTDAATQRHIDLAKADRARGLDDRGTARRTRERDGLDRPVCELETSASRAAVLGEQFEAGGS